MGKERTSLELNQLRVGTNKPLDSGQLERVLLELPCGHSITIECFVRQDRKGFQIAGEDLICIPLSSNRIEITSLEDLRSQLDDPVQE